MKRIYVKPGVKVSSFVPNRFMIPISGETTPEEADSKGSIWESEEEPGRMNYNVWDE